MLKFCDLPDARRMELRDKIEATGADVHGYYEACVQVALPRPSAKAMEAIEAAGLVLVGLHLFPLGSDNPPENMRHDGPYHNSRGFWLYANYRPADLTAPATVWTTEEILAREG